MEEKSILSYQEISKYLNKDLVVKYTVLMNVFKLLLTE